MLLLSFLLLSTTVISCAGGAGSPKGSDAAGTALAIKLPDTAKTLYEKEAIVSFTVTVSLGSFTSTKSANKGETMLFSNLPVGNYNVKAYGKTSSGAVAAKCETSVTIVAGETTTTTLHLARLDHWTVTFMNADGSELSTQDISDGYTATKPANPAPSSAGMAFSFWTADATATEDSTPFSFNTPITGNITLKPVFGATTYTITYVSAPQSVEADTFTINSVAEYHLPEPTKTGLTFVAWYTDSALTTEASVADATTLEDKTLYAKWTAKVQFKGENVSTGTITTLSSNVIVTYGAKVSSPGNPTDPEGATFGGWYTGTYNESTGKVTFGSAYNFNSAVTEDITLYAKWNFVTHKVTYVSAPYEDPNIPETEFREIQGLSYGDMYPGYGYLEELGLYFSGWTDDENYTWSTTPTTSIPANTTTDVTLYAMWEAEVSFAVSGYSAQHVQYGKAVTKPADPTPTVATEPFMGWYTSSDGGTTLSSTAYDFDDADTNKVTTSFTLYPKFGTLTMKTGSGINAALKALGANSSPTKTFSASATPPAAGTTIQLLSDTSSDIEVKAWCEGTSIKYYAAGFTDSSVKISLNADSSNMFSLCNKLTSIDVSGFDTSNVTDMSSMFANCSALSSLDLSGLDTSNVTSMSNMFSGCSSLTSLDVSYFDTSNVTDMSYMFFCCQGLTSLDVSGFDTSNVTHMGFMFSRCADLTSLDVSSFNTINVTMMDYMFNGCADLTTIYVSSSFVTTNVSNSESYMFSGSTKLKGGAGTTFNTSKTDKTYARIDGGTASPGYFTAKP